VSLDPSTQRNSAVCRSVSFDIDTHIYLEDIYSTFQYILHCMCL